MEMILELLKSVIQTYAEQFPMWLISLFAVIGSLRVVFKPLFSFLGAITEFTYWTKKDDELLVKVMESKVYKAIAYALDYIASIKLPKKK